MCFQKANWSPWRGQFHAAFRAIQSSNSWVWCLVSSSLSRLQFSWIKLTKLLLLRINFQNCVSLRHVAGFFLYGNSVRGLAAFVFKTVTRHLSSVNKFSAFRIVPLRLSVLSVGCWQLSTFRHIAVLPSLGRAHPDVGSSNTLNCSRENLWTWTFKNFSWV